MFVFNLLKRELSLASLFCYQHLFFAQLHWRRTLIQIPVFNFFYFTQGPQRSKDAKTLSDRSFLAFFTRTTLCYSFPVYLLSYQSSQHIRTIQSKLLSKRPLQYISFHYFSWYQPSPLYPAQKNSSIKPFPQRTTPNEKQETRNDYNEKRSSYPCINFLSLNNSNLIFNVATHTPNNVHPITAG